MHRNPQRFAPWLHRVLSLAVLALVGACGVDSAPLQGVETPAGAPGMASAPKMPSAPEMASASWPAEQGLAWTPEELRAPGPAYPVQVDAIVQTEDAKLLASDGAILDEFGGSVALSGDTALIGARLDNDKGLDSGSAYVFTRTGDIWTEQAKLVPSDGAADDRFGQSVALSGDTAFIGAVTDDDMGTDSGSAYVFTRSGGIWTQQQKLLASDGAAVDRFGISVALSGDTALIGAYADDDNAASSGSAYVFTRSGGLWTQQAKLLASDGAQGDAFGWSVALSGDTALIGARLDNDEGINAGSAYVFTRTGGLWTQQAKLLASELAQSDIFGCSVALSGDTALIGAAQDDDNGIDAGAAYVFTRNGGLWTQQQKLLASDGAASDRLGGSVALSGGTALIGAGRPTNPNGTGSAYVFAHGFPCAAAQDCTSGFCVDGVCCDTACGGGITSDCQACSVAAGAAQNGTCTLWAAGTPCHFSAGPCDVAETCDGVAATCPADVKLPAGTECRAAAGDCDVAEACDGVSVACPPDAKVAAGTECRASAGDCDVPETCNGVANDCPTDAKEAAGFECRPVAGPCDAAEMCDGTGDDCPADAVQPAGMVCRAAEGDCDAAETCDGASTACPSDVKASPGTECRMKKAECDVAETCNGTDDVCPADAKQPAGTVCRDARGICDAPESCDGESNTCPADVTVLEGTDCHGGVCIAGECMGDGVAGEEGGCQCTVIRPADSHPGYPALACLTLGLLARRRRRNPQRFAPWPHRVLSLAVLALVGACGVDSAPVQGVETPTGAPEMASAPEVVSASRPAAQGLPRTPEELRAPGPAYPVQMDAIVQTQDAKLLASDGAADDWFGRSVALSGDTALVGARLDDDNGLNSGSAYVFTRSGGIWTEQAKLVPSDGAAGDGFGDLVALSGDTALIGAQWDGDKGTNSGSAYVFTRSGGIWTEQAKLVPSDGAAGDSFGGSVALSGDTALIGAYSDDDNGVDSGSAYVFTRTGGIWTQQAKLLASDGVGGELFGGSVALSGDTALIGTPVDDDKDTYSGSAYVFTRSGGLWTQQAKLLASDGAAYDTFGNSVALSGDTALIGADGDDDDGSSSGSAYVFTRTGGLWTEQAKLVASDGAANEEFGYSVALSGDTALIGADNDDNKGSAYVFTRTGGLWTEQAKLVASDGAASDGFGVSVALSGGTALIGASQDNDNGSNSGSAYVFAHGLPCAAAQDCTSGFCVDGVCCDTACGGGVTSDCRACSVAAGAAQNGSCAPAVPGTPCRIAAGACDLAETCDGIAITCPADAKAMVGMLCRDAAGDCDVAEACDGVSAACPPDAKVAAGTECRGSAGDCDVPETCNGVANDCPTDAKEAAGTQCRDAAGDCDVAEVCDGVSAACPPDAKVAAGTECRGSAGDCDVPETCNGTDDHCPSDVKAPSGTECRAKKAECDAAETCNGTDDHCPADAKLLAGTVCRPPAGTCDAPESCDGTSNTCPADVAMVDGTACETGVCAGGECIDGGSSGGGGGAGGGDAGGALPVDEGGCHCHLAGGRSSHPGRGALALLALGVLIVRRRRAAYGLRAHRIPTSGLPCSRLAASR